MVKFIVLFDIVCVVEVVVMFILVLVGVVCFFEVDVFVCRLRFSSDNI